MTAALTVTDAGRALLADGQNRGVRAVTVTRIAIGDGTGAVDAGLAALRSERHSQAAGGTTAVPGRIALRADFAPDATYAVTEIGVFGRAGAAGAETLLAYWSSADAAGAAAAAVSGTNLVVAGQIDIANSAADVDVAPAVTVAIESVDDATTELSGKVELATLDEMRAGSDAARVGTAAGVRAAIDDRVPPASAEAPGKAEIATAGEADAGVDNERIVTPALVRRRLHRLPSATKQSRGLVRLATGAEAAAGENDAAALTPAQAKVLLDLLRNRVTELEERPQGMPIAVHRLANDFPAAILPGGDPGAWAPVLSGAIRVAAGSRVSVSALVRARGTFPVSSRVEVALEWSTDQAAWTQAFEPNVNTEIRGAGPRFNLGALTGRGHVLVGPRNDAGLVYVRFAARKYGTPTGLFVAGAPTGVNWGSGGENTGTQMALQEIPGAQTN